jgi:hypothetical protein
MANPVSKKLGDLAKPAESCLDELLQFDELKNEQWLVRLSVDGHAGSWEVVTADSAGENDAMIKNIIELSQKPVTELAIAFVGMIEWRGSKRLMAHLQYFNSDYDQGLLCLRNLKEGAKAGSFQAFGNFLIVGGCRNIWI